MKDKARKKMSKVNTDLIKKVREETGAGVMRVKQVLEQVKGNESKALEILKKEGIEKIVSVAELFSETDFVAKNELFENLGKNIALQVASMGTEVVEEQDFIKDPSKKIKDLVKEVIAKTGENIKLGRVVRIELGKNG